MKEYVVRNILAIKIIVTYKVLCKKKK